MPPLYRYRLRWCELVDSRERQRGGQKSGGGAKPHEETPHEKQFPTPLTSVRFAPPYPISLSKSLRNSQNFPQLTSSETIFGGSRKAVSDGPSSRGFAFRYVLPPPLALPSNFCNANTDTDFKSVGMNSFRISIFDATVWLNCWSSLSMHRQSVDLAHPSPSHSPAPPSIPRPSPLPIHPFPIQFLHTYPLPALLLRAPPLPPPPSHPLSQSEFSGPVGEASSSRFGETCASEGEGVPEQGP